MIELSSPKVFTAATALFQQNGYDNVSLGDIACEANLPLPDLVESYGDKEHIALAIYKQLGAETLQETATLTSTKLAQRYHEMLEAKLAQMQPHEDALSALFSYAMRPHSRITTADLSPGQQDPMMQSCQIVIGDASDAPGNEDNARDLAMLLYVFHFLTIIFWLYDRTDGKQATHIFTGFLRDFCKMLPPLMVIPMVAASLTKMARIMMLVFGGARLTPNK